MACAECTRLAAEQERLSGTHTAALDVMKRYSARRRADHTRLRIAVTEAWLDAECAKLELQNHKRSHAVSPSEQPVKV